MLSNVIDSRCYYQEVLSKDGQKKTALDEEATSAAIIENFEKRYHFERKIRGLCKKEMN